MNIFQFFESAFTSILAELVGQGLLPENLDATRVVFELPRDASHGDLATNAALILAKPAQKSPRDLAAVFASAFTKIDGVTGVDIAGPGFINLRVSPILWARQITDIVKAGAHYGRSQIGAGAHVNVEFVSANPTGPLHAAHARGAVIGDALAGLMEFCGWSVTREYYINDAGGQIDVLARSAYLRYCEALGQDIGDIPSGLYPGDYLKDVGQALAKEVGARYLGRPDAEWLDDLRQFSISQLWV